MRFKFTHTHHSKERWKERFSFLDIDYEWKSAKKATKSEYNIIKIHSRKASLDNKYVNYYLSENYVVFVIGDGDILITVIPYIKRSGIKTKQMCRTKNSNYKINKRKESELN